jgi:hypothetical protein
MIYRGCALISIGLLLLSCSPARMSGVTETGNSVVTGTLLADDGKPALYAVVELVPDGYTPREPRAGKILSGTTGQSGMFSFDGIDSGVYNIQAIDKIKRTRSLVMGVRVSGRTQDTAVVPIAVLRIPGALKVALPQSIDTTNGYVYIPGTTISYHTAHRTDTIVLDSVPAAQLPVILFTLKNDPVPRVIRYDIQITPGDTTIIANPAWNFSKRVYLSTTASGAGVLGIVVDFPVLVRLNQSNFTFTHAKQNGEDIRFTKSDNTPLSYEIERWNASLSSAEIWVKVDTVYGNDSTRYFTMYWGNADAADASNGAAVFDTADGYQGVWHMGQTGTASAKDATRNGFDGIPSDTAPTSAAGTIGMCQRFNGASNYIRMPQTAAGALNFPEHGSYAVSAWVYVDTLDSSYAKIIEKNDFQYKLQIDWAKSWSFSEYESNKGFELTNSAAIAKTWVYLVGVRFGASQYLYVNGICVNSSIFTQINSTARVTASDLTIGRAAQSPPGPIAFFKGMIDEARIENRAISADRIKLCYANQNSRNVLVVFK